MDPKAGSVAGMKCKKGPTCGTRRPRWGFGLRVDGGCRSVRQHPGGVLGHRGRVVRGWIRCVDTGDRGGLRRIHAFGLVSMVFIVRSNSRR